MNVEPFGQQGVDWMDLLLVFVVELFLRIKEKSCTELVGPRLPQLVGVQAVHLQDLVPLFNTQCLLRFRTIIVLPEHQWGPQGSDLDERMCAFWIY